jgi:hypothetical protein
MTAPDDAPPPLDACGFIRVPGLDGAPLWMTCEQCGKSDHFWIDGAVRCRCGARYGHARRPDGGQVPVDQLTAVPFAEGPKHLADLELDPRRAAVAGLVLLALLGAAGWWLLG